jgi:ATP-dependent exoDNAse (exonuclease V) beta subunit
MENQDIKEGYTRVSEILSQWDKYSNIESSVLERKKDLGTCVHNAIAGFFNGIPSVLTDDEGGKYFSSFILWYSEKKPVMIDVEMRMYDEDKMITGCIDAILTLPKEDQIILVDWKTSYNPDKLNWPLQASFYMSLLEKHGFKDVSKAIFVKLDKFGNMPKEYEFQQTEYLKDVCSHAIETYNYQKPWLEKRKNSITEEYME